MSAAVASPPRIEMSDTSKKDTEYEDDFEDFDKELDSFIATNADADNKSADNKQESVETGRPEGEGLASGDGVPEKGSEEIEKGQKEYQTSGGRADPEGDEYTFSEHQKRAMLELMAQRQENDFPDEEPPEYDVKDRLILLNAELAQESAPQEREHKVGFKANLVDLVAPPPDFTDDEESQRDAMTPDISKDTVDSANSAEQHKPSENTVKKTKTKTVVLERDGKFDVVNTEDLTPDERQMLDIEEPEPSPTEDGSKKAEKNVNNSSVYAKSKQPSPPRQPRPSTAISQSSRRQLRPVQAKQRPQSAAVSHPSSLDNFTYSSPYALSPQLKELGKQRTQVMYDSKKEEEGRKRQEKYQTERDNDDAFRAWLKQKHDEAQRKKEKDDEEKRKYAKEDKDSMDEDGDSDCSMDSESTFRSWLKEKRLQIRREKLLQLRQEQEMKDGYHTVSREECDKAFKDWIKKKGAESKKQRSREKRRKRSARVNSRRNLKTTALLHAIHNAQSFQCVDYYGYRY